MRTFGRQTIRLIFKGQAVKAVVGCLTLEVMTDVLSRNVSVCRWVTCMSNHTGSDARVHENDFNKSSIVLWRDRHILILEAPHS